MIIIGQNVVDWVGERTESKFYDAIGFGVERNGIIIGGAVCEGFNKVNINIHVASNGSRNWLAKGFIFTVFDYVFNQCKVKRASGLIAEKNTQARRFIERLGFRAEAILANAHPDGNLVVYRLFRKDCVWLRKDHEEKLEA